MKIRLSTMSPIVALIIVFGHLAVFAFSAFIGILALYGVDTIQTVLTACPVLAVTGLSAARHILQTEEEIAGVQERHVGFAFIAFATTFPVALLMAIFYVLWAGYNKLPGFGPDSMKIMLGGIETFFGGYIGLLSDTLFGRTVRPSSNASSNSTSN